MGVDVVHRRGLDARIGQRHGHRGSRRLAGRVRLGEVVGVAGEPVAQDLTDRLGPPPDGVLQALEHQHGAGLAHHEPVAGPVEGTAGGRGRVVARRERPHRVEGGDAGARDGRLGPTGQHRVGAAAADVLGRLAEGVVARGAGGRGARQGALQAQLHGHVGRRHVGDDPGDEQGRGAVGAPPVNDQRLRDEAGEPADPAPDRGADPRAHRPGDLQRRVLQRQPAGRDRELGEEVHPARRPALDEVGGLEPLDLARHRGGGVDRLVARDGRGAAAARDRGRPVLLAPDAERRDQAEAGHDDPRAAVGLPQAAHAIASPPSTESTAPVTKAASGEQRNATAPATSAGSPSRPSGVLARMAARCSSLRTSVMSVAM